MTEFVTAHFQMSSSFYRMAYIYLTWNKSAEIIFIVSRVKPFSEEQKWNRFGEISKCTFLLQTIDFALKSRG